MSQESAQSGVGHGDKASMKDAPSKFYRDFRQFMFANGVLSAAAGFSIGSAIKQLIEEILEKVFLPLFRLAGRAAWRTVAGRVTSVPVLDALLKRSHVLLELGWSLFLFTSVVVLTFVTLEYVINKEILGLRTRVRSADQKDFAAAKVAARMDAIFPTTDGMVLSNDKEVADMVLGLKMLDREKREARRAVTHVSGGPRKKIEASSPTRRPDDR